MSVHGQKAHKESIKMGLSCGFCPMSGKMYAMKEHLTTAHPHEFNKRMVAKLYYCNFCDFQNISERKLNRHIPAVHPDEGVVIIPDVNNDVAVIEANSEEKRKDASIKLVTAEEINVEVSKLLGRN